MWGSIFIPMLESGARSSQRKRESERGAMRPARVFQAGAALSRIEDPSPEKLRNW